MTLPTDAKARKNMPLATGVIDYFPLALLAIAELSRIGNDQHNPGTPLHWDRSKSTDEADALMRHFVERGTLDADGVRHSVKVAWRALALLQKEIEAEGVNVIAAWDVGLTPAHSGTVKKPLSGWVDEPTPGEVYRVNPLPVPAKSEMRWACVMCSSPTPAEKKRRHIDNPVTHAFNEKCPRMEARMREIEAEAAQSPIGAPFSCGRDQTPSDRAIGWTCTRLNGHDGPCAMVPPVDHHDSPAYRGYVPSEIHGAFGATETPHHPADEPEPSRYPLGKF